MLGRRLRAVALNVMMTGARIANGLMAYFE